MCCLLVLALVPLVVLTLVVPPPLLPNGSAAASRWVRRFTGQLASLALFSGPLSKAEVVEVHAACASPASTLVPPAATDRAGGLFGGDSSLLPSQLSTPLSALHSFITGDGAGARCVKG